MHMDKVTLLGCLYWIYCIVAIVLMVRVVLNNRDTVKTFAWMLVLIFLPFFGLVLYFFFGRDTRKTKMIGKRLLSQIQRGHLNGLLNDKVDVPNEYSSLVSFFENTSSAQLLPASDVEIISDTRDFSERLLRELGNAREHIHIQFYILENDEFGQKVRDVLVEKAGQGVEVRLMYDSVGCWNVNKKFYEEMRYAGIYVESFLKVRFPLFTNKVNYRNHRKVVVVDGRVGFVGGCNVADRYLNGVNGGIWRDTMLVMHGAAVNGLQTSFLVDWYFANRSLVSGKRYFPNESGGQGPLVQVVQSNPVGEVRSILGGYVKLLSKAKGYVYLQTPYFMPSESFLQAIRNAAMSGVDVRLMIPERADSRVADLMSMSYLGSLLSAGVKVYLYSGGFLHSKTLVCDDDVSSIGSANLDFRSFYYNFEVNAFVYDKSVAQDMKAVFLEDQKQCRQLTLNEYASRPFSHRCMESVARLFSPLL